jgi:hypothetical protein
MVTALAELGVTEASLDAGQQLDQKKYIRPETLASLSPAAGFILDV